MMQGARQYGNFLTLADARGWLGFPNPQNTSPQDANLQLVLDMACTWVQMFIGRPASAQEFFERHDGWGGEYIQLHESPVVEVLTCTEYQSTGGSISLSESTPENPIDGYQLNYATGRMMRTFAGYSWPRTWFPGSRNIEITYLAGFNPTPPDIRLATLEMIAHWWRNTQQESANRLGSAGAAAEYDPEEDAPGLWQGVPFRIIDLLDSYRLTVIA